MKICDLDPTQVKVGLQFRSLVDHDKIAVVVFIDEVRDDSAWYLWEGRKIAAGAFFGNDCQCEVIADESGNPIYRELSDDFIAESLGYDTVEKYHIRYQESRYPRVQNHAD